MQLPEHVRRLKDEERFSFACHPGVPCFTECCRELELALTPYDVIRLRKALGLSSQEFLNTYAVIEQEDSDIFPRVYLGMVDDGRASCPFVSKKGCQVYEGRPAPCRTYPLGRGAWQDSSGAPHSFYVVLQEEHCRGFSESVEQTIDLWNKDQGLDLYYKANDLLVPLLLHEKIKKGFQPSAGQKDLFLTTLYNLENFTENSAKLDDLQLIQMAVDHLVKEFFS